VTTVEAARWGAGGLNKRATLTKHFLKKESRKTALSLTEKWQKVARQIKSTTNKKGKLLTLTLGDIADGRR
jgi:NADH dehydrogenase/NADH:ubiquinone oxidoreductase subunit G